MNTAWDVRNVPLSQAIAISSWPSSNGAMRCAIVSASLRHSASVRRLWCALLALAAPSCRAGPTARLGTYLSQSKTAFTRFQTAPTPDRSKSCSSNSDILMMVMMMSTTTTTTTTTTMTKSPAFNTSHLATPSPPQRPSTMSHPAHTHRRHRFSRCANRGRLPLLSSRSSLRRWRRAHLAKCSKGS
jgi:hypothetical protein